MKYKFPGHFQPSAEDYKKIWGNCIFAVDANVLLNLYRYSPSTRRILEKTLSAFSDRIYIPHQAALEFLRNRCTVIASQSEEYKKATDKLKDLFTMLTNTKKHPFVDGEELKLLNDAYPKIIDKLEHNRKTLISRLNSDEVLDFVANLFDGKTGEPLSTTDINATIKDGESRYKKEIPPGYKDCKKDNSGDEHRKYGDLFIWKQLINHAKEKKSPIIFITDDKKEDWWLEQSGRTIGPRPELIHEFVSETSQKFWMYTVEKFMEEYQKQTSNKITKETFEEIKEISKEIKSSQQTHISAEPIVSLESLYADLPSYPILETNDWVPAGLENFLAQRKSQAQRKIKPSNLIPIEIKVLQLKSNLFTNLEIARTLNISKTDVLYLLMSATTKLLADNETQAIKNAIDLGIIN